MNSKFVKRMLSFAAAATMALTLMPVMPAKAADKQKITLEVGVPEEYLDGTAGDVLKKECEEFAALNPDYDITFNYKEYGGIPVDAGSVDAGYFPDVFLTAEIPRHIKFHAIGKLTGKAAEIVRNNNTSTAVNSVSYNGSIYGVPVESNTWFMYYDKRVFSEDDVKNLDAMLKKGRVAIPAGSGKYFGAFLTANGCTFSEDGKGLIKNYDFDSSKVTEVVKYLVNLVYTYKQIKCVLCYDRGQFGDAAAEMENGRADAAFGDLEDEDLLSFFLGKENIGCAVAPSITINGSEKKLKPFMFTYSFGVYKGSENREAATALALFLGSEQAQKTYYEKLGRMPANKNLIDSDIFDSDPAKKAVAETLKDGNSLMWAGMTMDYRSACDDLIDSIYEEHTTESNAEAAANNFIAKCQIKEEPYTDNDNFVYAGLMNIGEETGTQDQPSTPSTPSQAPEGYSVIENGGFNNPNDTTGASYAWVKRNSDGATVVMKNGAVDSNEFISDSTYTYYVQADGTVMKDRLTYHPDGTNIIYFDSQGHEVFNTFAHPTYKITQSGNEPVADGDQYYFNMFGYMYKNTVTYDVTGTKLYYIDPNGCMQHNGWFFFDQNAGYGDTPGAKWTFTGSHLGFANYDGTLLHDAATFDYNGTPCYMQGNGEASY